MFDTEKWKKKKSTKVSNNNLKKKKLDYVNWKEYKTK